VRVLLTGNGINEDVRSQVAAQTSRDIFLDARKSSRAYFADHVSLTTSDLQHYSSSTTLGKESTEKSTVGIQLFHQWREIPSLHSSPCLTTNLVAPQLHFVLIGDELVRSTIDFFF